MRLSRAGLAVAEPRSNQAWALAVDLARAVEGDVRFDGGSRHISSSDASDHRQVRRTTPPPSSLDEDGRP